MDVPVNKNNESLREVLLNRSGIIGFLAALALTLCGALAGYFATIYGIKIDLAGKAESQAVYSLEKRVLSLEIYLKEKMLTKEEFLLFRESLGHRLDSLRK